MKKPYVDANVLSAAFEVDELASPEVLKGTSKTSRLVDLLDGELWTHLKLHGNNRGLPLQEASSGSEVTGVAQPHAWAGRADPDRCNLHPNNLFERPERSWEWVCCILFGHGRTYAPCID